MTAAFYTSCISSMQISCIIGAKGLFRKWATSLLLSQEGKHPFISDHTGEGHRAWIQHPGKSVWWTASTASLTTWVGGLGAKHFFTPALVIGEARVYSPLTKRATESQSGWGWKGQLEIIWSSPLLKQAPHPFLQSCFPASQLPVYVGTWGCSSPGAQLTTPLLQPIEVPLDD